MYRIMICVDEHGPRAKVQAETVAELPVDPEEVVVHVFHSFEDNPAGATIMQFGPARRVRDHLSERGFEISMEESSGPPEEQILDLAGDLDIDLICLAGRKRTPVGKFMFGSVAQEILLNSKRPVLTTGVVEETD